jgi:hypothetical protein
MSSSTAWEWACGDWLDEREITLGEAEEARMGGMSSQGGEPFNGGEDGGLYACGKKVRVREKGMPPIGVCPLRTTGQNL